MNQIARLVSIGMGIAITTAMSAFLLVAPNAALAQAAGRVVMGFGPASALGVVTTLTADKLREGLGRPFIHDNRAGGEGFIAIEAVKSSEPSGYTLLMAPIANICIYPHTWKKLPYDPMRDFIPVSMVGAFSIALTTGPAAPTRNIAEFIAWAKANPKQAAFGSPGTGNIPQFYGMTFAKVAGITLSVVPYKGPAPLINDLLGGHVAASMTGLGDFITHARAGRVNILAHTGRERSKLMPDVPTFRELGYQGLQGGSWYGLFAPAGTPAAMVDRINRIVVAGQQAPDMNERMLSLNMDIELMTAAEFAATVRADFDRWGETIRAAGFAGSE